MKIAAICVRIWATSCVLALLRVAHHSNLPGEKEVNEIVKGQKVHRSSIKDNLRCGSCDVCPPNSNIISGRDKVVDQGGDEDDEEEEGGDWGARALHAEQPDCHQQKPCRILLLSEICTWKKRQNLDFRSLLLRIYVTLPLMPKRWTGRCWRAAWLEDKKGCSRQSCKTYVYHACLWFFPPLLSFCLTLPWRYNILASLAAGRIICGPLWGYNIALVPAARRSWKRRADRINKTTGDDTGTPRWRHNIAKPCNSCLLTSSKNSFLRGSSYIYL